VEARDELLQTNLLEDICEIFKKPQELLEILRNSVLLIMNLVKYKNLPQIDRINFMIPSLWNLLYVKNVDIIKAVLQIYVYLTCGNIDYLKLVLENVNLAKFTNLLDCSDTEIVSLCIRILGNFSAGPSTMTNEVLETDCLPKIKSLISTKPELLQEICFMISNIAASHILHIGQLIEYGILEDLCKIVISHSCDLKVKNEIAWTLTNACILGEKAQIWKMVEFGILNAICELLNEENEPEILVILLDAIFHIFMAGEASENEYENNENILVKEFEEIGGTKILESMQYHKNVKVYNMVASIMKRYFDVEEVLNAMQK